MPAGRSLGLGGAANTILSPVGGDRFACSHGDRISLRDLSAFRHTRQRLSQHFRRGWSQFSSVRATINDIVITYPRKGVVLVNWRIRDWNQIDISVYMPHLSVLTSPIQGNGHKQITTRLSSRVKSPAWLKLSFLFSGGHTYGVKLSGTVNQMVAVRSLT